MCTNERDEGSGGVHVKFVPEVRMMVMSAHGHTASGSGVTLLHCSVALTSVRIQALLQLQELQEKCIHEVGNSRLS